MCRLKHNLMKQAGTIEKKNYLDRERKIIHGELLTLL